MNTLRNSHFWKQIKRFRVEVIFALVGIMLVSCAKESAQLEKLRVSVSPTSRKGTIVVASTTFQLVAAFNPDGSFQQIVNDYSATAETPFGLGYFGGGVKIVVDGSDRVENWGVSDGVATNAVVNANLTSVPIHSVATDSSGNMYVSETSINTIEKFSPDGTRAGNPFITTTIGACTLSAPRGLAVNPSGRIAVASSGNNRLQIYSADLSTCTSVAAAPFGSGTPYAVAYHQPTNRWLVGFTASNIVASVAVDGSTSSTAYNNSAVLAGITAIAVDANGAAYVTGTSYDTVEKFTVSGTTMSRVGGTPLIPISNYIRDPQGLTVITE